MFWHDIGQLFFLIVDHITDISPHLIPFLPAPIHSVITMATMAPGQAMCMKHDTDESRILPREL